MEVGSWNGAVRPGTSASGARARAGKPGWIMGPVWPFEFLILRLASWHGPGLQVALGTAGEFYPSVILWLLVWSNGGSRMLRRLKTTQIFKHVVRSRGSHHRGSGRHSQQVSEDRGRAGAGPTHGRCDSAGPRGLWHGRRGTAGLAMASR